MYIKEAIKKLALFQNLSSEEMTQSMQEIMRGDATHAQTAAFLMGLAMKNPTASELIAATKVMRSLSQKIQVKASPLLDIVGTGGDCSCTFNISTAATFVVAAAGATVAKHGNRSVSSSCGSSDVLEEAGINLNLTTKQIGECIAATKLGFLFAPSFHSAIKYAAIPRKELGIRTFFNLLGPLTNPANADHLVIGVYDKKLLPLFAEVLKDLKCHKALIVHSQDGLDEISIAAPTDIAELSADKIKFYEIKPTDFGMKYGSLENLKVNNARESLSIIKDVLNNKAGQATDIVLLNAGAAIYIADLASSLLESVKLAKELLSSGKALAKFEEVIAYTQRQITSQEE